MRHETKHQDVQYMFLKDLVENGEVIIKHIGTDEMVADCMTKGLGSNKHGYFRAKMG
ncbi:hypothetical protein HK101_003103, partial [Irineochytrium annulatum]